VSSLAGSLSARPRPRLGAVALARAGADAWLTIAVGLALTVVAFAADGGLRIERTTWTEVALILAGAALVAWGLLTGRAAGHLHGGLTLLAFAALAVLTALSIIWSVAPGDSWLEANRTFAYVATFAGGIALVRLAPGRWAAVLNGVALACLLVCGWALLTKIFPAALAPDETYARLREPFGYWNAVGLMAALGVPPLLWLAARRSGHPAANALAWPALSLLFTTIMLSYSRGSLLALLLGLAVWFAVVPLRLRGALPLLAAAVVSAPVIAWAFARDALTTDNVPLAARVDAGHELGTLLALMACLLLAAGLAVNFATTRAVARPRTRRLVGRGLLGVLALIPVALLLALASSAGGIDGQVSSAWKKLTDPMATTPTNTPDRLRATSSVRARYWREAWAIYQNSPDVGAGAGAYATARTRYRTGSLTVRHAHGYGAQTLADLGRVGVGISLLASVLWILAAMAATGLRRRDRGKPFDPERVGLLTMAVVVIVFGAHSLIDWTWFVPGDACVALLCAAWVAGRGPLSARADMPARVPFSWRRPPRMAGAGAVAVLVLALVTSWAALQPVRSAHAADASLDLAQLGKYDAAAAKARRAAALDPLSVDPLFQLAFIDDARGDTQGAKRALEDAARLQPANVEAWRRLGRYRLSVLDDPRGAVDAFRVAFYLDPASDRGPSDYLEAARALKAKG
jgi:cytochrome c-type biogenesis protein CcmH/NrfG